MTREELIESLGTIAHSGTAKFLKALKVWHSCQVPAMVFSMIRVWEVHCSGATILKCSVLLFSMFGCLKGHSNIIQEVDLNSWMYMQESQNDNKDNNLIGQFGVGFYSAFLVADKVDFVLWLISFALLPCVTSWLVSVVLDCKRKWVQWFQEWCSLNVLYIL